MFGKRVFNSILDKIQILLTCMKVILNSLSVIPTDPAEADEHLVIFKFNFF